MHITLAGSALEGGAGSGNFGHAGRKGKRGGSTSLSSKKGFPSHYGEGAEAYAGASQGKFSNTEIARLESGAPAGIKDREPRVLKEIEYTETVYKSSSAGKQGLCFQSAAEFAMGNKGWEVVHATLYPRLGSFRNKIYFHAFAQKSDVVYDGVFDKFYAKKDYYEHYSITDIRKFSVEKALDKAMSTKVWGAWDA